MVRNFNIPKISAASQIIDPLNGSDINFQILENRSDAVYVTITVGTSSPYNQYVVVANGHAWNNYKTTLSSGSNQPLPYETAVTLRNWKGEVSGGYYLPSGSYAMKIAVTDGDGNDVNTIYSKINEDSTIENDTQRSFTIDSMPPGKPMVTHIYGGHGQALVEWSAPTSNGDGSTPLTDLKGYYVYSGTANNVIPTKSALVSTNSKQLYLDNGKEYFIMVTAVDNVGNESLKSNWVSVTPMNATWVHPEGGPSWAESSIADALSWAYAGETVMVGAGTYQQSNGLDISAGVILKSERGPGETIIEGQGSNTFIINTSENARIVGFTIKSNKTASTGIKCWLDRNALISNNIIHATDGTGIYVSGGTEIRIYNNVFTGNIYGIYGAYNMYNLEETSIAVYNNIFLHNRGAAIRLIDSNILIDYNAFYANQEDVNVVAGNSWNIGTHNKSNCNPQFVNYSYEYAVNGDYHLQPESCAINAGKSDLSFEDIAWKDIDGSNSDLGAYGGPFTAVSDSKKAKPNFILPVAYDLVAYATTNGGGNSIVLSASNPQGGALSYTIVKQPDHGTLSGTGSNRHYTPSSGYIGPDRFTFSVTSSGGQSNIATITINVIENKIPTLDPISDVILYGNGDLHSVYLGGITAGLFETQSLTVTTTSSNPGLIPTPDVNYTSPDTTGILSFTPVTNASGLATITVTVNDGQSSNNIYAGTFTVIVVNELPTLDVISNISINQNAGTQTIRLSGISAGSGESQPLTVTASSSNTGLIPNPTMSYTSPNATGSMSFTPVANAYGSATITVTVDDGESTNNTVVRSFVVTVNNLPTLDAISNVTVNEDAGVQTVSLNGISAGSGESQPLSVTATSSDTGLVANPAVNYTSPNATGTLSFTPKANANGTATITVTVNDGQSANSSTMKTFVVTVIPVNDPPALDAIAKVTITEDAGLQSVVLTGITAGPNESQVLTVTATSSKTSLLPHPTVNYTNPGATGSLTYTSLPNASGTATVTVTVNDGQGSNNTLVKTFTVVVTPVNDPPTLAAISNVTINEGSGLRTVSLSGISAGPKESQILTLTARSSTSELISDLTVNYTSPSATGTISFIPAAIQGGTATITVTVDDGQTANSSMVRGFLVTVNSSPTDIFLSSNIVNDATAAGTTVGTLSTSDPNAGDTFAYSIVGGDTTMFRIEGSQIKTDQVFAYTVKNPFTIRIRSTDNGLLWTEKEFTVVPPSYVLWTNSATGQAMLWKVDPVTGSLRESLWISTPAGVGAGWQASSYERGDAATDYVLWTNSTTGKSTRWKVDPATGIMYESKWVSPTTGVAAGWQATSYAYGDATTDYALWTNNNTGKSTRWKVDRSTGEKQEVIWISPTVGLGAGWQASSYERGDATMDYVLWTNSSTGQTKRWKVSTGTGLTQEEIWLSAPEGVGPGWQASSYERGDATTDYVLWTNSSTGKSTRWKVNPDTGAMTESLWISSAGLGAGWLASSYVASERIGMTALEAPLASGEGEILVRKVGNGAGTVEVGAARCGPGCDSLLLPSDVCLNSVVAIPEVGSRFVGWESTVGQVIDFLSVQPGESVLAVFEKE